MDTRKCSISPSAKKIMLFGVRVKNDLKTQNFLTV
jgi:hypothetical protein